MVSGRMGIVSVMPTARWVMGSVGNAPQKGGFCPPYLADEVQGDGPPEQKIQPSKGFRRVSSAGTI